MSSILTRFDGRFLYPLYKIEEVIRVWGGPSPYVGEIYRGIYNESDKSFMIDDRIFDGVYIKCIVTKVQNPDSYSEYINSIKITPDTSLSTTAE